MALKPVVGFPHDLLKPLNWKKHEDPRILPENVRQAISKYKTEYIQPDGNAGYVTLEQVIEGHGRADRFWERIWHEADRLSAAVARLRLEYDYWHDGQAEPFFIPVYGDFKIYNEKKRREICDKIFQVLEQYAEDANKHEEALRQVNEFLKEFPSDSRFPFVSLSTHHLMTDVLRKKHLLQEKCWKRMKIDAIYLIRISMAEPEFHKLKERRQFHELRSKAMGIAERNIAEMNPLRIGDDLYVVSLSEDENRRVISALQNLGFDVEIFEWRLDKTADGLYLIRELPQPLVYSTGSGERLEARVESQAEWAKILDEERYTRVCWIFITPVGDMEKVAEKFLDWAEAELTRRYGSIRRKVEKQVIQKISLNPELMFSIAEQYNIFLRECAKTINPKDPESAFVIRSFNRSLFLHGLHESSEALKLYYRLMDLKGNLHIPVVLSMVVAEQKYPVWRTQEIYSRETDGVILLEGGKMVKLEDEDIKLLRPVINTLYSINVSRGQFHELINASRKESIEYLKILIEGKATEGKIHKNASQALLRLIEQLARRHPNEEELRDVIYNSFKLLEPFTKKEEKWERRRR